MPRPHSLGACLLAAALALAAGCDSAGGDGGAAASAGKSLRKAASPEAARLEANMVKAVRIGEGQPDVDLKFELTQRPEVGKPVEVSVALIPNVRLERLYARFQPAEELDLIKGGETDQIARPAAGTPIMHTLTVVPKRDGIFTLTAVVLTDSQSDSVSRSFSIPIIAGTGLPEPYGNSPKNPPGR